MGGVLLDDDDVLVDFLDRLKDAREPVDLKQVFNAAIADLGFKYFTYHVVRVSGVGGRLPYIISSYPEQWLRHYFAEGYLDEDPVLEELPKRQLPFCWSEVSLPDELSAKQKRLFDEARDAGIKDGITIPIHGRTDFATMSLVPDGSPGEVREALKRHRHLLHLLSLYYHDHSGSILLERSMSSPRQKSLLSPREKEVLQWTAKGKSNWDISVILNISEKSVEFHLDGAKRKLQVFNRTHAVVKAIMLGMISVD
jgi:DNA-binding CsgD family transcriptional regulator